MICRYIPRNSLMVSRTSTTFEVCIKIFKVKKKAPTEVQKLHRTRKYMGKKIWMYRPFTSGRDCQQAYKYFKVNA